MGRHNIKTVYLVR